MNRIVIIGNGFDLAHGLPSRYEDFLLYLLNNAIYELNAFKASTELYKNLFSLIRQPQNNAPIEKTTSLEQFNRDNRIPKQTSYTFLRERPNMNDNWLTTELYSIRFNSKLFHDLFTKVNWTDVEKTYFDLLLQIFKIRNEQTSISADLSKLNSDFEEIKRLFIQYITSINTKQLEIDNSLNYQFEKCYWNEIYDYYDPKIRREKLLEEFTNEKLEKIVFVNFNYTNILNYYKKDYFSENTPTYISIHGETYYPNSIVFGYGDETTEYYKQLEDLDSENVLKHFKNHYYHSNNSYAKLLYEVESNEFDVIIFGHSLGLSDRLLLKTIFENKNCKYIHLFHSGSENHFKKRIALSRHFDDKREFRKKLLEKIDYLKIERKK